ncbi:MAG: 3'-5' exonuclease [Acidihalobacter sp.]
MNAPQQLRRRLQRAWYRRRLRDPAYRFLLADASPEQAVAIDCETTSLDAAACELIAVAAIPIEGDRILMHSALELLIKPQAAMRTDAIAIHQLRAMDVAKGQNIDDALCALLEFIGPRPLVGYYIDFDLSVLNRYVRPILGIPLPNPTIDVSGMYFDRKIGRIPQRPVNLGFDHMLRELKLPVFRQHDPFNDALMAALCYVKLRHIRCL